MERRKFLQTSGVLTAGAFATRLNAIAGPFPNSVNSSGIPADKKLDPEWIKSLYKRGFATKYLKSKNELQYIGMPVGGINTGTLYLGGDGRLWLWDIFNSNQEGINPEEIPWDTEVHAGKKIRPRDGSAYVAPAKDIRPIDQGFVFTISSNGHTVVKRMLAADWDDIVFEATYPLATITYIDKQLPVQITAEVFSPFIALDELNSGLPATIYAFSFKNTSAKTVTITTGSWLENKIGIKTSTSGDERVNTAAVQKQSADVFLSINGNDTGKRPDAGSMSLAVLAPAAFATAAADPANEASFVNSTQSAKAAATGTEKLVGSVAATVTLQAGQSKKLNFIIAWHFPNLSFAEIPDKGRFYNTLFKDAGEVTNYVKKNFSKLAVESRLWKQTWYDSTLPHWFLERTFVNIACLATTTSHRMESGRYYAWEGIGCCPGTCTHVWQYAQAAARIFPNMERDTRERIDLGLSLQNDGSMWYRCEADKRPAVDGQAGTILRFYREHQLSSDAGFLTRNWDKIKSTILFLMRLDKNGDGMEDTPVENTLDAMWDGEIAWIVGLCIAAVKAGEMMAIEMNDTDFAKRCAIYVATGKKNMEEKLFNGEYFIHQPDAEKGRKNIGSYNTCHIDQVYGQSWAWQAGLGRVFDQDKTRLALRSLWKYNFTPDVGPYLKTKTGWRPYALPGEGGMLMNTNPKKEEKPYGDNGSWQMGYFHECMSGFEHQVAAHMMAEGMVDEALVLTRMIHDRYHAAKRNPFNEIECSDHYARAMASYGTFISACGFEYHGPKGHIKFAPKMQPANFKAPFTTAAGWGTYQQQINASGMNASLQVKYGTVQLQQITLNINGTAKQVAVKGGIVPVSCKFVQEGNSVIITLQSKTLVKKQQQLTIKVSV